KLPAWPREVVRQRLVIPSPYFVERGFRDTILAQYDVGQSAKFGKDIVPLYDESGDTCVGFMAWSESRDGEPQWTLPTNFPKASYLYAYHAALRSQSKSVLLVESPCDVWRAEEAGCLAVASLGADLSSVQAAMLVALTKEVLVAFDNDEDGRV